MRLPLLLLFLAAAASASASAQRRQQFADYDYELAPTSTRESQRTAAGRGRAVPNPGRTTDRPDSTTAAVEILKQINEHNEDGSYTYGYESSDGSFKLETRYPDGLVQGKYGYIDIDTGALKVIEYGADMMGFQPQGDFPEGIIIPEPVFNNLTDDQGNPVDYDDGEVQRPDLDARRIRIENRARTSNRGLGGVSENQPRVPPQQPARRPPPPPTQPSRPEQPDQNRGQDLQQPITPRPLPRAPRPQPPPRPQQQQPQAARPPLDQSRFQTNFAAVPAVPAPAARPTPTAERRPPTSARGQQQQTRVFARPPVRGRPRARQPAQQQQQQQRQQPAQAPAPAPTRVIDPSPGGIPSDPLALLRAIAGPVPGGARQQPTSTRSRGQSGRGRARPAAQKAKQSERPRSSSSSGGANRFSSFPAQDTGRRPSSGANFAAARQPEAAAAPSAPRRPVRIRPRPEQQQQARTPVPPAPVPVPDPQPRFVPQPQFEALPPRPNSRPAIPAVQAGRLPLAPALDFDALIQEFTGGRTSAFPQPQQQQRFTPAASQQQFQTAPAFPGLSDVDGASFSLHTG